VSGHIRNTSAAWAATCSAEVERRAAAGRHDPWRLERQREEVPVEVDTLPAEQGAQDLHDLERPPIARSGLERLPGKLGGDDVHGEPSAEDLIDRRELAGELGRPHLAHADREQQLHS
jgi:hypothetical protein